MTGNAASVSRGTHSRRLRILMSAYTCAPNRGSEYAHGWNWPLAMARRGHDVTVITTPRYRDEILSATSDIGFPPPSYRFVEDSGASSLVARGQFGVYAKYLTWQRRIVDAANAMHSSHNFDLVHHVSWGSLQGGSRLDALSAPLVFGPVGGGQVAPLRFLGYFGKSALSELLRSLFATALSGAIGNSRAAIQHSSIVLAANRETLVLAKRLGGRSVLFFQDTGIETALLDGSPTRDWHDPTLQLVWVGRLFPRKGLRIALEALARLPAGFPVRLTIVGDGPERQRLMTAAASLGVNNMVDWRGQVSWRAALAMMDAAHASLFTSLRDTGGAQILEAQARGLPVITLNHQGAADHVPDDAGMKIPVTTPRQVAADLARAIEYAHQNRPILQELSTNAIAWAESQTWEEKAKRMEAIYSDVLGAE